MVKPLDHALFHAGEDGTRQAPNDYSGFQSVKPSPREGTNIGTPGDSRA